MGVLILESMDLDFSVEVNTDADGHEREVAAAFKTVKEKAFALGEAKGKAEQEAALTAAQADFAAVQEALISDLVAARKLNKADLDVQAETTALSALPATALVQAYRADVELSSGTQTRGGLPDAPTENPYLKDEA